MLSWLKKRWDKRRPFKEYLWPPTSDMESAFFAAKYGAAVSFYLALSGALALASSLWMLVNVGPGIAKYMTYTLPLTAGGLILSNLLLGYLWLKASRVASIIVLLLLVLGVGYALLVQWDRHISATLPVLISDTTIDFLLFLGATIGIRGSFAVHRHRRGRTITSRAKLWGWVAVVFAIIAAFAIGAVSAISGLTVLAKRYADRKVLADHPALPDRPPPNEGTKTKAPDPVTPLRLSKEQFSSLSRDWKLPVKKENLQVNSEKISDLIDKERESTELDEIDIQSSEMPGD